MPDDAARLDERSLRIENLEKSEESERLEKLAYELAQSHTVASQPYHKPTLIDTLDRYDEIFDKANQIFRGATEKDLALSYAAEWMLDNYYVVRRAIREIREDLPWKFYRQLPKLASGDMEGLPRVYALAHQLIVIDQAKLDISRVKSFVHSYQAVIPLTMGELWALPIMLRLGIIQSLALSVTRTTGLIDSPGGQVTFPIDLSDEITDDETISHSILSLRTITAEDWKDFFEDLSLVDLILNEDPVRVYSAMDFETRDRYRKIVEAISLSSGRPERDVAREAVSLAQSELDKKEIEFSGSWKDHNGHAYFSLDGSRGIFIDQLRMAHVGYYLLEKGRFVLEEKLDFQPNWSDRIKRWFFKRSALLYLGSIYLITLIIILPFFLFASKSGVSLWWGLIAAVIISLPAVNFSIDLINWIVTKTVKPLVLPKMDFNEGVPGNYSTLVVVPALLANAEEVKSLIKQLELHYLRNQDANLYFGLLTDFNDAPREHMPDDDLLIKAARDGIRSLNERYRSDGKTPFHLFHRKRQWNPSEGIWMGWERKRGKLHELNRLILGENQTSFLIKSDEVEFLQRIKYVITLDADTVLPRESAYRLIAALAHPLNRAEFNPENGEIISGYSVLQPRTDILPTSANQSIFTRIFAGDTGLDLYSHATSDVYQDLFGEGIYVGKGIYDVDAFERSLEGRIPQNALLSHDLYEGIHGRAGLVTDVVLFEEFPPNYLVHIRRSHRWVRGDWQLLPWLFPKVPESDGRLISNTLSVIDRWKILDNIRRSLVAPSVLLLLIAGWLILPGSALLWTIAGALTWSVPILTALVSIVFEVLTGRPARKEFFSLQNALLRWMLALLFLPFEALLNLDAITTTLFRLFIRRRNLLHWTTSAHTVRLFGEEVDPRVTWRQMYATLVLSILIAAVVTLFNLEAMLVAAPMLVAWLISPEIASIISRPIRKEPQPLTVVQQQSLRNLARRTWLFFEQYIGPEDHWLPPDHFQESPLGIVAHRTSPTNIGLLLFSTLAAYDLGYLGLLELTSRVRSTFENLQNLERFQGHFLNWYDTRNLEPLPPRYVSTVDSGNLAACLICLGQGLFTAPGYPIFRWEIWQGFLDTLSLLTELLKELTEEKIQDPIQELNNHLDWMHKMVLEASGTPEVWMALLRKISLQGMDELDRILIGILDTIDHKINAEHLRSLRLFTKQIRSHLENAVREIEMLLPWLPALEEPPELFLQADIFPAFAEDWRGLLEILSFDTTLQELEPKCEASRARLLKLMQKLMEPGYSDSILGEACNWCERLLQKLESAKMTGKVLEIAFTDLHRQAETLVNEMDFSFLFDDERQVFRIGYNVSIGRLDDNFYDLLGSEARIASLTAIAKQDVPLSHWLHLSRPFTRVDSTQVLLSWSATIFEYLMPLLVMRNYPGTLLHQSIEAVTDYHIAYCAQKSVPWGISESGYYRFDENMYYQYRAFGVPGLGYKRGLAEDLVITPYASILALPIRPAAVVSNLEILKKYHMLGVFGFYEALDFTPSRLSLGQDYQIVQSYMSHHQGMILGSLVNYLKKNVMVERFHADPRIQSVELLLQEQIPDNAPTDRPHAEDGRAVAPAQHKIMTEPWRVRVHVPQPRVHYLSNGRYNVLIASSGAGYSSWGKVALTRWRSDTTLNPWGTWIYVKDLDSQLSWSVGYLPMATSSQNQDVFFTANMAEFIRRDHDITVGMEITVAPEEDVEIRVVNLTNHTDRLRHISLTSYGEVVLADQATDQRHPAFNKLFIESEYLPEVNALIFRRRPRSNTEEPIFMAHVLLGEPGTPISDSYESDRERFLGRGTTARFPKAIIENEPLSGTAGATLDPIMALRQEIQLGPHARARVAFMILVANSRSRVVDLIWRYRVWHEIERAFDQARTMAEVELRQLGLENENLKDIQLLLSLLLYPHQALRSSPTILAANIKGQPGLWGYGISGDYPVLLVRLKDPDDLSIVNELLKAHAYWRNRNLMIDMVFLNEQGTDYGLELNSKLYRLIGRMKSDGWINRRGGIFLLRADQMTKQDIILLQTAARVVIDGEAGPLKDQLQGIDRLPPRLPPFYPTLLESEPIARTPALERPQDLIFDNGLGGFSPDGREYTIYLEPGKWTPAPWINVIANPEFGFTISESGSGFSWAVNSGENRLSPWSNDPVSDPPGEALYLRDEETAKVWSVTPLPIREEEPYLVRHGAGYSMFEHNSNGLQQRLRMFAAFEEPLKIVQLRLENTWDKARRLTVTYYVEWVLGNNRESTQPYIVTEFDDESQALLARNAYNIEFGDRVAFLAANKRLHGLTADRTEFLGRMSSLSSPAALARVGLASRVEAGVDPCAALQLHIDLMPGEVEEIYFLVGQGADRKEALALVKRYQDKDLVQAAWKTVNRSWDEILGTISVRTPEPGMDVMLNRWLLYQALSCRIWGRSGFYQSSGAYGFRDQLQDVMSLVHAAPELARQHLLRSASHQFDAGDVLHWWHPPSGRGMRTRISDDLIWLPYVTAYYISTTGDYSVLDESIPFRKGPALEPGEDERYGHYLMTEQAFSLYEHCRRAIEKGATSGPHRLPLIGGGDWNDGMNRVGIEGRGESVWLGWFLYDTLQEFAGIQEDQGMHELSRINRERAGDLRQSLEAVAWDGEWYLRAFYDDGTPLGSAQNLECQIDAIAQSWAVLSGAGDPERIDRAMRSVAERLVRDEERLILLFTPPFDKTSKDPGYIKGYLPGIRENGGQYTHAAIWTAWAFVKLGHGEYAEELFRLLNPIYHSDSPVKVDRYRVEPYVIAADVYGVDPHVGRGGWTWYTGSSGWMYRLGIEAILGLRRSGDELVVNPCIPRHWPGFEIVYRFGQSHYSIGVENPNHVNRGIHEIALDGTLQTSGKIPLIDDGKQHHVRIIMG